MFYALAYYPELKDEKINELRRKYDPYADLIREHVTLIFPVPETIGEEKLTRHIEDVLKNGNWKPFRTHISGYQKTWDNWLFLKIKEGKDKFIQLHDALYTGILQLYLRKDLPFTPHVGIGLFTKERYDPLHPEKLTFDEEAYNAAVKELNKIDLDYYRIMNQLNLIKINKDFSKLWEVKTFYLG